MTKLPKQLQSQFNQPFYPLPDTNRQQTMEVLLVSKYAILAMLVLYARTSYIISTNIEAYSFKTLRHSGNNISLKSQG